MNLNKVGVLAVLLAVSILSAHCDPRSDKDDENQSSLAGKWKYCEQNTEKGFPQNSDQIILNLKPNGTGDMTLDFFSDSACKIPLSSADIDSFAKKTNVNGISIQEFKDELKKIRANPVESLIYVAGPMNDLGVGPIDITAEIFDEAENGEEAESQVKKFEIMYTSYKIMGDKLIIADSCKEDDACKIGKSPNNRDTNFNGVTQQFTRFK